MSQVFKKIVLSLHGLQSAWSAHREHTILLSKEKVNKGTKRVNSLLLSPLVFSFILKLVVVVVVVVILQGKPLGNTVALNSDPYMPF